ncbi:MAG: hypothetical protein QM680_06525 [Luteolibacter sp.]
MAITHAFTLIRAEKFDLASAGENQVTERLEDMLENCIRNRGVIEGFDSNFFGKVARGSETVNYCGKKISKKPDLIFNLRREHRTDWDQRQDAIFVECKPVDKKHRLGDHYCAVGKTTSGIERFVIGDYAWAMEQAMMIAYVRDGFQILSHLAESLVAPNTRAALGEPSILTCVVEANNEHCQGLYCTSHQRLFPWADGRPATPIDLYHTWHEC